MSQTQVVHSTFVLERTFPVPAEHVFAAFANPELKRKWFADSRNHTIDEFTVDFRVGGLERFRYRMGEHTPIAGMELAGEGTYLDIVENRRIVTGSWMSLAGRRISASLMTIELRPVDAGTEVISTHQGAFFEGSDGPAMREDGWKQLLESLRAFLAG